MTLFEILLVCISLVSIALFIALFLYLSKKLKTDTTQDVSIKNLQGQISDIQKELKTDMARNIDFLQKQSGQSVRLIQQVTTRLEQLDSTNKQVVNFAQQLQSLENILRSPKQRGILGEYFLEQILDNILPPGHFKIQYAFKNGEVVDAAIFIRDKVVPIDAKFSLEKYNRLQQEQNKEARVVIERELRQDVKNRIDETSKYIRPDENTMDFAMMFIPAEGIFHYLLSTNVGAVDSSSINLIEYSNRKKVIIVSPTTFVAYLQTILQALRALQVENNIKDVIKGLQQLNKHYLNYDNYFHKLGNQIGTTVNTYNTAYKEFAKINKDMNKLIGEKQEVTPLQLDKPADLS